MVPIIVTVFDSPNVWVRKDLRFPCPLASIWVCIDVHDVLGLWVHDNLTATAAAAAAQSYCGSEALLHFVLAFLIVVASERIRSPLRPNDPVCRFL